jgi:hypothetical protein
MSPKTAHLQGKDNFDTKISLLALQTQEDDLRQSTSKWHGENEEERKTKPFAEESQPLAGKCIFWRQKSHIVLQYTPITTWHSGVKSLFGKMRMKYWSLLHVT